MRAKDIPIELQEEIYWRCKKEGATNAIAKEYGISVNKLNLIYERISLRGFGHNVDRHLCLKCIYRYTNSGGCNYYSPERGERGCHVAECNKFIEGEQIPVKMGSQGGEWNG